MTCTILASDSAADRDARPWPISSANGQCVQTVCNLVLNHCRLRPILAQARSFLTMSAIHWDSFFFLFFALVTCVFAVAVVVSNNIVRMASYLVAVAVRSGRTVLPLRRPVPGGHATHALCRRHRRAADLRRHAHGQGDRSCRCRAAAGNGSWPCLAGGSLLAVLLQTVGQVRPIAEPTPAAVEAAATDPDDDPVGRRPGRRPHRQRRPIMRSDAKRPDATSATSCRLRSFPSISWSSSWAPRSWHGPSAASGPGNRDWSDDRAGREI